MTTHTRISRPQLPAVLRADKILTQLSPLVGRTLIGAVFSMAGYSKIGAYAGTQAYMESAGLPGALLPLVIAFEIGAGLALILGLQTQLAALLLSGFTLLTALMFHFDLADPVQSLFFFKNMAIAGGLLVMAAFGAGPFSLDHWVSKTRTR